MKNKAFNIYGFTAGIRSSYYSAMGVYHKDGRRIACNGKILVVDAVSGYSATNEGKILCKDGSVIEARYPSVSYIIDSHLISEDKANIDLENLTMASKLYRANARVSVSLDIEGRKMKFDAKNMLKAYNASIALGLGGKFSIFPGHEFIIFSSDGNNYVAVVKIYDRDEINYIVNIDITLKKECAPVVI